MSNVNTLVSKFTAAAKELNSVLEQIEKGNGRSGNIYGQELGTQLKQRTDHIKTGYTDNGDEFSKTKTRDPNIETRLSNEWLRNIDRCIKTLGEEWANPEPLDKIEKKALDQKYKVLKASVEAIEKFQGRGGAAKIND